MHISEHVKHDHRSSNSRPNSNRSCASNINVDNDNDLVDILQTTLVSLSAFNIAQAQHE